MSAMVESPLSEQLFKNSSLLDLSDILIHKGVGDYELLDTLKREGWANETLDKSFKRQRDVADSAGPDLNRVWFHKMKDVLREMDKCKKCIPPKKPVRYLDLGWAPGGFTSYVLDKNKKATGLGISLGVAKGGHEPLVDKTHKARFEALSADLTYYQLGPAPIQDKTLRVVPFEIRLRSFDLAILDGHHLRIQPDTTEWDIDRLLISQIILGLQGTKIGGTIIVKMTKPERVQTAKLLLMLDTLSTELSTFKARSIHANRSTFYVIAKGVGRGIRESRRDEMLGSLQKLWVELTFGGEDGRGRCMTDDDLDFIMTIEELKQHHLDRLVSLVNDTVWAVQTDALQRLLPRRSADGRRGEI